MNKRLSFSILVLLATLPSCFAAGVKYEAKVWRSVQTYDLQTLSQGLDTHVRELLAIKCNFRGKDIRHTKPNWYQSSVWQNLPDQPGKFAHIEVMVAKADLSAFKSLPMNSAGAEMTLYGRVEYDVRSNFRFLRLVGRNASVDANGNAIVSW